MTDHVLVPMDGAPLSKRALETALELFPGATAHVLHVVVGSHGRDEESRVLLGSVSESVAFRSPVSVTLVR